MKKIILLTSLAFFIGGNAEANSIAEIADNTVNSVKQGKPYLKFRYRFEANDDDAAVKNAYASTLRSVVGFETAPLSEFMKAAIEFENVSTVGKERFNSGDNGKTQYPLVSEIEITELNQLYFTYDDPNVFSTKLGRQIIDFDNERFVGEKSWRQNQQTLDAIFLNTKRFENFDISYAYVANVNRSPGNDNVDGDWEAKAHLLNVGYQTYLGKAAAYAYLMEFDNSSANSSQTLGLNFDGKYPLSQMFSALYRLEYADQTDYGNNPNDYNAGFYQVSGGVGFGNSKAQASYEVLESEGSATKAFRTPIGSTHRFQGWADKFASTPAQGVEDLNFTLSHQLASSKQWLNNTIFTARYHDFSAENTSGDYGSEMDFSIEKQFDEKYYTQLKVADFDAEPSGGFTDTKKLFITFGANF